MASRRLFDGAQIELGILPIEGAAAGAFTLVADGGVYTYSGNNVNFLVNRVLTADGGVYTYVGNNADLIYSSGPPPPPPPVDIYFIELRSFTERRRM